MPSFQATFMGRFAYLLGGDGTVVVAAPTMPPTLGQPHVATLVIPTRFVEHGEQHAIRTVALPGEKAATWLIWSLDGVDVEFRNVVTGGAKVTFGAEGAGPVAPDLLALAPAAAGPAAIDPVVVAQQLPPSGRLNTRFKINGGTLDAIETVSISAAAERLAFRRFEDLTPVGLAEPVRELVDGVKWTGETTAPNSIVGNKPGLRIRLRKFDGSSDFSIVCGPHDGIQIGVTYTCVCTVQSDRDEEYAAYYDLLAAPPPVAERFIPVLQPLEDKTLICGVSPDCQGIAFAKF